MHSSLERAGRYVAFWIFFSALAAPLVGCGGGSDGAPPPTPIPTQAATATPTATLPPTPANVFPSGGAIDVRVTNVVSPREVDFQVDVFVVDESSVRIPLDASDFIIEDFTGTNSGTTFQFQRTCAELTVSPDAGPYSAVILLDQSGSIISTDPNDLRIEAASLFFNALGAQDDALLAAFADDDGALPFKFNQYGSFGRSTYDAELAALAQQEGGGTPLYDAIAIFANVANEEAPNPNKAVVIFTDGEDTASERSLDEAISSARNQGVRLFPVGLDVGVDLTVLGRLAEGTDGSLMFAQDARQLISLFGTLGNLLGGNLEHYRTCWKVRTDSDFFNSGSFIRTSIRVRTEGTSIPEVLVPFLLEVP